MKNLRFAGYWLLVFIALGGLALGGCVTTSTKPASGPPPASASFPCVEEGELVTEIITEAKLLGFDCRFDKYKKQDSLFFKVTLQNASDKPQRFRVNIFLDNGKAVGGLVPRKGKPPVLKPGQKATVEYPVQGMDEKPGGVTLFVKPASY